MQATLDKASALGGKTVMPVTDLGGAVTIAMFNDLDGLLIGAGTRRPYPRGMRRRRLLVQASRWTGLRSSDRTRRGRSSSTGLLDWKVDTRFPGYAVTDTGIGRGIQGGIGGGADARWAIVYAGVPDVDQTLSRAEELGGSRDRARRRQLNRRLVTKDSS